MTPQEIKSNAPEEATHYEVEGRFTYYFKDEDGKLFVWNLKKGWIQKPIDWLKEILPL